MSIVAVAGRPRMKARELTAAGSPILLNDLRPVASAEILDIGPDAAPAVARRLHDLGFVPGADVVVVRRAPMADPVSPRSSCGSCSLPARGITDLQSAGVDPADTTATSLFVIDNSYGADIGRAVEDGPRAGELLSTPPVVAALLAFFLYALHCMSTIGKMRREFGSWKWPAIARKVVGAVT